MFNLPLENSFYKQIEGIATSDDASAQIIMVAAIIGSLILMVLILMTIYLVYQRHK